LCPIGHDGEMGSTGPRQRKAHKHLPKVPKYEEPNTIPLAGLAPEQGPNPGRFGYGADHHAVSQPGRVGSWLLRLLGKKPGEHV
jgi:hypothetical protein